ncbi:MAG: hypothetical protein N2316_01450 [Spirochaetes bacterium]|nr:hypothetical protein [Spirochaetota bacterium]
MSAIFNKNANTHKTFIHKFKEGYILFIFIILSAITSLIAMDALVFPIALFATTKKELFLTLFGDFFWLAVVATLLFMVARKIRAMKLNGIPLSRIVQHLICRPLNILVSIIGILLSAFLLVGIIYLLLSYNYYFIYRLLN